MISSASKVKKHARRMETEESLYSSHRDLRIGGEFSPDHHVTLYHGNCMELLSQIPTGSAELVVTSPPYNIGKEYESKLGLRDYLDQQEQVIRESARIVGKRGSICWQVGNFVDRGAGAIIPLDIALYPIFERLGLKMRNRIIWHFEHGLHCSRRFSGRYEVILWFTRSDNYIFHLDPVRVPQKYPGKKYFKGPRAGEYSCHPLGKNPGDLWVIPNVKHNHVEKTEHPCQFPVELIERLVLSLTDTGGLVVDPFMGAGSTAIAAFRHGRRAAGAEIVDKYVDLSTHRLRLEAEGRLATRPMNRPVYSPARRDKVSQNPFQKEGW